MVEQVRRRRWGRGILLGALLAVVVAAAVGAAWFSQMGYGQDLVVKIQDYFQGQAYQPSAEMAQIRDDLMLTERGEFLFNAAQPELDESTEFNARCRESESENAVLGCYTGGRIFIYNIVDAELEGIRELTTAHELLHAVYARMDEGEKEALRASLEQVLAENQAVLESDLANYDEGEQFEELYVRAGTEIANLPDDLERHYAEIFRDQDAVVRFYDNYIEVFRVLKAEMDELKAEMDEINAQIETSMQEYERRVSQLNADIVSFNSCAEVEGCFATDYEFYVRRAELMNEQESLGVLYEEIGELIGEYNEKVVAYNADVVHSEKLNTVINSMSRPNEIEEENE